MNCWPYPIKAVIFDNDGVLLDTLKCYYQANSEIIGFPYPEYMRNRTNGRTDVDVCKILIDEFNLSYTPEQLLRRRFSILERTLPNVEKIEGVMDIVMKIREKGIKIAVATSSRREGHSMKTQNHHDLFSLFDADICGDEVKQAKPSPEIFLEAAKKLGDFSPENILVFEDAPLGIKAANDAKMASVLLWTEKRDCGPLLKECGCIPSIIIPCFKDFNFGDFKWEGVDVE